LQPLLTTCCKLIAPQLSRKVPLRRISALCQKLKFTEIRQNRRFSLKADISDNHGTETLENFEISTHCHKVKNECIIHFGFQERTVFQTISMWPKIVDHYSF